MENTIHQRIEQLMKHYNLNPNSLAKKIGTNDMHIRYMIKGRDPNYGILKQILKEFPNVNCKWLMLGVGDMLGGTNQVNDPQLPYGHNKDVYDMLLNEKDKMIQLLKNELADCKKLLGIHQKERNAD